MASNPKGPLKAVAAGQEKFFKDKLLTLFLILFSPWEIYFNNYIHIFKAT